MIRLQPLIHDHVTESQTTKSPVQALPMVHAPLIVDVAGLDLTAKEHERLAHPLVGGVILFTRNWHDRAQLTRLCAAIKGVRQDLLIAVDHEGGRVQRFQGDGFTHLPSMAALGKLWQRDSMLASETATACGYVLAAELRTCGVDFSFTPVLDLDYVQNKVIGERAFSRNQKVVTLLAKALMHGLLQAGMRNCGKHFPGHGFVSTDSHTGVPVDERSLALILRDDAKPYAGLNTVLDSVMPAHVIYSQVDSKPAGFSKIWLQDILRQRLGFEGAIFSDDLSMAGARVLDGKALSYTQATQLALQAGCDLLLLCNQSTVEEGKAIDVCLESLVQNWNQGRWQGSINNAQRRLALLPQAPAMAWEQLASNARYQASWDIVKTLTHPT